MGRILTQVAAHVNKYLLAVGVNNCCLAAPSLSIHHNRIFRVDFILTHPTAWVTMYSSDGNKARREQGAETMTKTHFALRGSVAICGANQGKRLRSRVQVTGDPARVTCAKCADRAAGAVKFSEELAQRLAVAEEIRK
jgi:hypothetical protein